MSHSEKVRFRLLLMPCCHHQVCWVNPRLPNHCPECGTLVVTEVRSGSATLMSRVAWLRVTDEEDV